MLHSSGWLIDAAVSIRRREKAESARRGASARGGDEKFFDRREEKFLAECISPLVVKRSAVLLSAATGRLTAADVPRKNERAPTRHAGATAAGGATLKRLWRGAFPARRGKFAAASVPWRQ
ncbi:hypothetical protein RN42_25755 [Serratia marcescens]|nr:hypothetical protein RN42_25755 [Serratia marcescens]